MIKKMMGLFLVLSCFLLLLSACQGIRQSSSPSVKTPLNNSSSRDGATLHAIIVADTNDDSIGDSVKVDLGIMIDLANDIKEYAEMALNVRPISGRDVNYRTVKNAVESLSVNSDDTVIFYYAGHGFNRGNTAWPTMSLEGDDLSVKTVRKILQAKNPRLLIVIADTCNGFSRGDGFVHSRNIGKSKNYKTLFLKYQGTITASAAQPGEFAWSNPQIGGFFTNAFIRSLNKELISNQTPSWNAIFSQERATAPLNNDTQHPQAKVAVQLMGNVGTSQSIENVNSSSEIGRGTCQTRYTKGGKMCCRDWQGRERCWSLELD